MSQNTTATAQPRTVQTADRGKLDIHALVLLAILLAAGFILNFTVGKAISGISGGMISPEFIISAFCLTILVVRPNIGQALVIGLISAAVIQITTTSPFVDFAAEGIAAMLMAVIVNAAAKDGQVKPGIAIVATFVTTFVSGVIFMVIKMAMLGVRMLDSTVTLRRRFRRSAVQVYLLSSEFLTFPRWDTARGMRGSGASGGCAPRRYACWGWIRGLHTKP